MKKLTCHCGGVEIQIELPEKGFEKLMRCNCSLCKRRGYIMTPVSPENFKLIKGQDLLKLYQYHLPHNLLLEMENQLQLFARETVTIIS